MHRLIRFLFAVFVISAACCTAFAQNAQFQGCVTDPQGKVVPGAEVRIFNQATGVERKVKTNDDGIYSAPFISPGTYQVFVQAQGFSTVSSDALTVTVGQSLVFDVTLRVGSSQQEVTVEASSGSINTTDAAVSTVIDRQFVENLPMNGRSFQTLIDLTPGVTLTASTEGGAEGQFSVNGQRSASNYWTVDGVSANIGIGAYYEAGNGTAGGLGATNVLGGTSNLVSVDALQEFRIQTSTYAPEFGRTPGGQVSISTRSGTNHFHGSIFDYFRNYALDATDWFADRNGLPKAAERQNDFGGVLGGPLLKDKAFFFLSYEGLRLSVPETALTAVPDLDSRKNAVAAIQPFLNAYPLPSPGLPDLSPGVAPFNATFSNPATVDAYSLRLDGTPAKNWNLFARYNFSPSKLAQRTDSDVVPVNNIATITVRTNTGTVGATWTKSSNIVNEARFNYSANLAGLFWTMDDYGGGSIAPGASLFASPFTYKNGFFGFDPLIGNATFIAEGNNGVNTQHQYNVVDILSVQSGSHALKFGVDYRRLSPFWNADGYEQFVEFASIADAVAGNATFGDASAYTPATFLFHNIGVFSQDTWRVSPRLTLTYGLRWDIDVAPTTESGPKMPAVTGYDATNLSSLALAPPGTAIYGTRYGGVAPRIGAALQISQSPDWGLVFRSGFGVFYDLASSEVGHANLTYYPFAAATDYANVPFPFSPSMANPPAIVPPDSTQGTLSGFDPNLNLPYTLQWSAAFEQGLGKTQSLTVTYVGSHGSRLLATENIANPNPNYLAALLVGNAGFSNYSALQMQFRRNLYRGLQTLISYSWAHSIDTGSYGEYTNGTFANSNANKGDSDFDIRNAFTAALTYDVPSWRENFVMKTIFGGWSTENNLQIRSPSNVSVVDGAFTGLSHQNSTIVIRPDVVPGQPLYLYGSEYPGRKALNPSAFISPPVDPETGAPLRQGNFGRNSLRGFGLAQWDFAVHREIPIHELLTMQFRAEMFNVLNHPNFGPFDSTTTDSYFGQATQLLSQALQGAQSNGGFSSLYQLGGPRSIQLALKLMF